MVVIFKNKKNKKQKTKKIKNKKKLSAKKYAQKKCATQNSFRMKLACREHVKSMSGIIQKSGRSQGEVRSWE
jgi:hypothetical protein